MAVLDRTTKQKQSAGLLFGGLILGAILFSGVLLSSASRLSDHTGSQTGQLFGLRLFELTKQPMAGGGFTASMIFFGQQLAIYFAAWLLLGAVAAVYRSKRA